MKKKARITAIIMYVLCVIAMVASCILIHRRVDSRSGDYSYAMTEPITSTNPLKQTFRTTNRYLYAISFALSLKNGQEGVITFELSKEDGTTLFSEDIPLSECQDGTYHLVELNQYIQKNQRYQYTLSYEGPLEQAPMAIYNTDPAMYVLENQLLMNSTNIIEGQSLTWYVWGEPLNVKNLLFTWLFIWMIGIAIYEMMVGKDKE